MIYKNNNIHMTVKIRLTLEQRLRKVAFIFQASFPSKFNLPGTTECWNKRFLALILSLKCN